MNLKPVIYCVLLLSAFAARGASYERLARQATIHEASNMAVAASSVTGQIAFDLQGAIWTMPLAGGAARRITAVDIESRLPVWSPDGARIAFQCYRDNQWHICSMDAGGAHLEQLTAGVSDDREPTWTADGSRIIYVSDQGHNFDLFAIDVEKKAVQKLAKTEQEEAFPAASPHGGSIAYVNEHKQGSDLVIRSAEGEVRTILKAAGSSRLLLPSWRPDGGAIAFVRYDPAAQSSSLEAIDIASGTVAVLSRPREDVFASRASWLDDRTILYAADGGIRKRKIGSATVTTIPFTATLPIEVHRYAHRKPDAAQDGEQPVLGILRPHVSPDGSRIAFAALGDLWLLESGTTHPKRLTDDTALDADPVFSPDGQSIIFTSDRRESGTMDLCAIDLRTGQRQVLESPGESVSLPNFAADGARIAYFVADSANWHSRTLHILDLRTGQVRSRAEPFFHPSRASWSPDGKHLVVSALEASSGRFRKGWSEIYLIDASDLSGRFLEPMPGQSLGVRAANGPEWSPDGSRLAFVMDGSLWTWTVSRDGEPAGPPLRLTNELADSISWTRDGRDIVYLSNGKLSRVNVQDGSITRIELDLKWRTPVPAGRLVVRAGRLFDATTNSYRRNVDIVVEGRRIAAIESAHRDWGSDVRVIDARTGTVIPGLFESHIHNFTINGEATGRMFLAFGVTSIREVGADPYDALESKEAWASGARPGPRDFYSGLLEGGRVYYPMSLAISSVGHLNQELDRSIGLGYDLIKTYERLPDAQLSHVIDFAHRNGLTVTSHDLWPAAAHGADMIEHLEARDRGSFSDRRSFAGKTYGDVIEILRQSGMAISTTEFGFFPGIERPAGVARWSVADLPQVRGVLPRRIHALLGQTDAGSVSAAESAAWKVEEAAALHYLAQLRAAGIPVIPATDGSFHLAGLALIREIIAIHNAGIPMVEVLRAATQGAARVVGVDAELGTIERGKLADLVIIDGDPLRVPTDLTRVTAVVKDGRLYTQEDLTRRER